MSTYVLDACVLIAFFNGEEEGANTVESLLSKGENVLMSMLNAFEVCYNAARSTGKVDTAISILHGNRLAPSSPFALIE